MSRNYLYDYKTALAGYLDLIPENVFLFWKGRVALYAILEAIGVKEGDEVILPAFTCVVVPNAIKYLKAKPVYVDIDPQTYNLNIDKLEENITPKTKVILAQNTFGLSPDLDKIFEVANAHGIKVIEDCTHGFGGRYKGKLNGTIADASFYSSQWNKPFSTGIGGIAVVKNQELMDKMKEMEKEVIIPGVKDELVLKALIFVKEKVVTQSTYWMAVKLYRFLSDHNLIIGSSQGEELEKPSMPEGFLKGMTKVQAKKGISELKRIDRQNSHRMKVAEEYHRFLAAEELDKTFEPEYAKHTFLKYPLKVKDREKFIKLAEKDKIELGEWFNSPIHPIQTGFELWDYDYGKFPVAEAISKGMINLPTGEDVDEKYLLRIKDFIRRNKHLIK